MIVIDILSSVSDDSESQSSEVEIALSVLARIYGVLCKSETAVR